MNITRLERLYLASRTFLQPGPEDFRRLLGDELTLPFPQRIFLEDEDATPVLGFPVLQTRKTLDLRDRLEAKLPTMFWWAESRPASLSCRFRQPRRCPRPIRDRIPRPT